MSTSDENLYRRRPARGAAARSRRTARRRATVRRPGYGPPPGYGRQPGLRPAARLRLPAAPYGRPTNTMAILALVLAFVFAPAGLILGIVARKQIRQTGEDGDGLALAGIIVGGIVTAFFVLLIVFWIVAFASIANGSFGP